VTGNVTLDGFLNRRLTIAQPGKGFRAGHDSVLLAASVPAEPGDEALELGAGVGVASLCLAARVEGCRINGFELDPALVTLANDNAARNALQDRVSFGQADIAADGFDAGRFDRLFLNPPFHPASGSKSDNPARARAMHDADDALNLWTRIALRHTCDGGTVSIVLRADRLEEWAKDIPCAVTVLPLAPREGDVPKRALACLWPGTAPAFRTLLPFILHRADGAPTPEAEEVLRHGGALPLAAPAA
jgi:tRNA1Val (adenine37-N6)-methyltransferase